MAKTAPKPSKAPRGRRARAGEAGYPATVRLTPDERAAYGALAELAGLSLAEWIRLCCERERRRVERQR